ncbi:MAG: helix-turn-helix transcriptional regulator [Heyndrickxia sp.]
MSNIHRIVWFDHQVRNKRYPNSKTLAEKFEISNRQALRDIEYMVNTMGAPITYVPKKRGYEYEENTYMIPYQVISEEERNILAFLGYRYRQLRYENSPTVNRVAALFDRLAGEERKDITQTFPFYSVPPRTIQLVHTIHHSIKENKVLKVTYYSEEEGAIIQQLLEPITILFKGSIDYLVCYDSRDSKEVLIDLKDITELMILLEKESRSRSHSQLHSLEQKPFTAEMEMLLPFKGESWHGFSVVNREENMFKVEFYDLNAFIHQFLASCDQVRIIGPNWLKEQICEKCQSIINGVKNGD